MTCGASAKSARAQSVVHLLLSSMIWNNPIPFANWEYNVAESLGVTASLLRFAISFFASVPVGAGLQFIKNPKGAAAITHWRDMYLGVDVYIIPRVYLTVQEASKVILVQPDFAFYLLGLCLLPATLYKDFTYGTRMFKSFSCFVRRCRRDPLGPFGKLS